MFLRQFHSNGMFGTQFRFCCSYFKIGPFI
jgi:hypothetical protein